MKDQPRISVANFDSVAQASSWLTLGAEAATDSLLAMLRTALLLGGELVVDRNQLFDGVFFLALGPDRICEELGLPAGSRLPITMTASPSPADGDYDAVDVPRFLGAVAGLEPASVSLGRQLADVRRPAFVDASSAMAALTGGEEPNSWLTPDPSAAWFPGCGFTDVLHPMVGGRAQAAEIIATAQQAWVDAAAHARITVDTWSGQMLMDEALIAGRKALAEACASDVKPAPLAVEVLELTTVFRREAVTAIGDYAQAHPELSSDEMRMALSLWSRAYYQAIAWADGNLLISFNDTDVVVADDDAAGSGFQLARSYGLAMPARSGWQKFWDRRGHLGPKQPMRVEGEILDNLRVINPGAYRQLQRTSGPVVRDLIDKRDPSAMFDLALASREAVAMAQPHKQAVFATTARIVTMTTLAVVIAVLGLLGELGNLNAGQSIVVVLVAAILGLLSSLPWDDIAEQWSLRRSSMTATLNLREDR